MNAIIARCKWRIIKKNLNRIRKKSILKNVYLFEEKNADLLHQLNFYGILLNWDSIKINSSMHNGNKKKTEQFQFFPSANFIPTSYRIPKSFIVYVLLFFYYNDKIPKKSKWHN